jgi:hypothetical protein
MARAGERIRRSDRLRKFWSGHNRIRLMLTLEHSTRMIAGCWEVTA